MSLVISFLEGRLNLNGLYSVKLKVLHGGIKARWANLALGIGSIQSFEHSLERVHGLAEVGVHHFLLALG